MRTDSGDAHFLHERPALQALVSPGVDHPRAICWVPNDEALVLAARSGALTLFEPAYGTRSLGEAVADPARMHIAGDRIAVLSSTGILDVRSWPELAPTYRVATGLIGHLNLVCWAGGVAVAGDDGAGVRRVIAYDGGGKMVGRVKVPLRVAVGVLQNGFIYLARGTTEGMSVTPVGRPIPPGEGTAHVLRVSESGAVLGIAAGGVTLWRGAQEPPVTIKCFDASAAALSPDGEHVAIGTRIGRIAYARPRPGDALRGNPVRVEGHNTAVFAVEFSRRARWLATCAERCWVWSY